MEDNFEICKMAIWPIIGLLIGTFIGLFLGATTSPYPQEMPKYCFSEQALVKTEKTTDGWGIQFVNYTFRK